MLSVALEGIIIQGMVIVIIILQYIVINCNNIYITIYCNNYITITTIIIIEQNHNHYT